MQILPINSGNRNSGPNFGHSFRVSICLKNESGCGDFFVGPRSEKKLYRLLNSKIVGWLNEDFLSNLRTVYGIEKKVGKTEPIGKLHREMIDKLKQLDTDYAKFPYVRTIYNRGGRIAHIATGSDVAILENIKGLKNLGVAKADAMWNYGTAHTEYVKALSNAVNGNAIDYVSHDNVLLRSPKNKEIMLRAVFKESGKNTKGDPVYELDRYEFHENYTKRTLAPVNLNFLRFKQSKGVAEEIKKTVEYILNKIVKKRVHVSDIDSVLNTKTQISVIQKTNQVQKTTQPQVKQKPQTMRTPQPKQLELKFKD
jgi:hypothetical protein